uniref:Uncharacterized protein n=1 Tax=Rhizophora mucronata TaxID=61149 RepID=A0A2P2QN71_RHIMU
MTINEKISHIKVKISDKFKFLKLCILIIASMS